MARRYILLSKTFTYKVIKITFKFASKLSTYNYEKFNNTKFVYKFSNFAIMKDNIKYRFYFYLNYQALSL